MSETEVNSLKQQLVVARQEINNLRKELNSLSRVHQKDIIKIQNTIKNYQCENCSKLENGCGENGAHQENHMKQKSNQASVSQSESTDSFVKFKPIGVLKTVFPEKRGVPRQSTTVGSELSGYLEINPNTFNNPEHSLDGLNDFSHMWIIYHFHKNDAHTKSKVSPPRLGGERVGVFGTRSPHRPCPIGLSLVQIDRVEKSRIYFQGTDMIDGTPVLDIKPYIPQYDCPVTTFNELEDSIDSNENGEFFYCREEPDGEESNLPIASGSSNYSVKPNTSGTRSPIIKIPQWIREKPKQLKVIFNERAEAQINEYGVDKSAIEDILAADPRSVYLRTKYGTQIFTFLLSDVNVTCKFDDKHSQVTVVRIRHNEKLSD